MVEEKQEGVYFVPPSPPPPPPPVKYSQAVIFSSKVYQDRTARGKCYLLTIQYF